MENSRKKLIANSAAYILGMKPSVKIKGSDSQIKRFEEVLNASKSLYLILQEGSLEEVSEKLSKKKILAKGFYDEFGWKWPF